MSFAVGDTVLHKKLRRLGRVEAVSHGRCQIQIGSVYLRCKEEDLEPAMRPFEEDIRARRPPRRSLQAEERAKLELLDLHGCRVNEALALLDQRLSDALMHRLTQLQIVHGIGSGALMQAVHRQLRTLALVSSFRLDERNPGVTWVYFP